mgnify:CR=1 FL=1
MKKTMSKLASIVLSAVMLAAALPMAVTAEESDSQLIKANADTYIDKNKANDNYSTKDEMLFQNNNNYNREAWVRFNLGDIKVPQGKQIESAKIKVWLASYYNTNSANNGNNKTASNMSLYTISSQDYDPSTITWGTANRPQRTASAIAWAELCTGDTWVANTAYEFDITDYMLSKDDLSGNETFAFFPDTFKVAGSFYTSEYGSGEYTPVLSVSYKEKENETHIALDSALAQEDGGGNLSEDGSYNLQNSGTGTAFFNRAAYIMFDMNSYEVPAGKVVTKATLRLYAMNNHNKKDTNIRIHNLSDDNWSSSTITGTENWADAPGANEIKYGRNNGESLSDVKAVWYDAEKNTSTVNQWVDFDVTEFVTQQMAEDEDGFVSFAAYPDEQKQPGSLGGAIKIGSAQTAGSEPRLVLEYGDASDVTFGKPTFAYSSMANISENVMKATETTNTITYVHVPVSGASAEPTGMKLYIAQYDVSGALIGVTERETNIYSANGDITFSYYPIVPKKLTDSYTRAFVWNEAQQSLSAAGYAEAAE